MSDKSKSDTPRVDEFKYSSPIPSTGDWSDFARQLEKELGEALGAAGFCEKHKPNGGVRNCLVCACEQLTHALDTINSTIENDTQANSYCISYDEQMVVGQVKTLVAERDQLRAELAETITRHNEQLRLMCAGADKLEADNIKLRTELAERKRVGDGLAAATDELLHHGDPVPSGPMGAPEPFQANPQHAIDALQAWKGLK